MNYETLDAQIAQTIMKWTPVGGDCPLWFTTGKVPSELPRYSSDIKDAMGVLERVCEDGFIVLMRRVNQWYVEFSPRTINPERNFGRAQHESLPRAICLAALETVKQ